MANCIKTTGTTPEVATTHENGESVRDWVARHTAAVSAATPNNHKLSTNWPASAGPQTVVTERAPGESNEAFLTRHIDAYLSEMVTNPPIP